MIKALRQGFWSIPNSLAEGTVVEKSQKEGKDVYTKKPRGGIISGGSFEKFANITQYSCALLSKGEKLSGVLGGAFAVVDATRVFGDINTLFFNGDKSKNGWELAARVSALFFDGLTTLYTLHTFKIIDLSWIASGIGTIAAYGGFGFVAAIGAVPLIHIGIASYIVFTACSTLYEKYKETVPVNERSGNKFADFLDDYANKALNPFAEGSQFLQTFGKAVGFSFRIISVTTGTAPVLLPALGIISNVIGEIDILGKNIVETEVADELFEKNLEGKLEKAEETSLAGRVFNVIDHSLASMEGMDKLCKVGGLICKVASAPLGGLAESMSNLRLTIQSCNAVQWISGNFGTKEGYQKFIERTKVEIVAQTILFTATLVDLAGFVASTNIANLGAYAGKLGECRIFGITAKFSFGAISATLKSVFIAMDLYSLGVKKKWTWKELKREDFIKIALSIGKIVGIVGSGAFIFYGGVGASTAFAIYNIVLASADAVNWIYKNERELAQQTVYS